MAKFDAVERLMSLATEKATPAKEVPPSTAHPAGEIGDTREINDAEAVLEAKVSAGERGVPHAAAVPSGVREDVSGKAEQNRVTPSERGRQLLGALRPFLPAVSGALRMVDHGAVQAVARMLPLLGSMGEAKPSNAAKTNAAKTSGETAASAQAAAASSRNIAEQKDQVIGEILTAFDKRHLAMAEELKKYKVQAETHEDQLRRMRDGLERTVAEQGLLANLAHQLADRSKLLTAGIIVLLLLVAAEMVMLGIIMHR